VNTYSPTIILQFFVFSNTYYKNEITVLISTVSVLDNKSIDQAQT